MDDRPLLVGRYELGESLGAGGMGRVVRAFDRRVGRDVAVKFLATQWADNPRMVARFQREARAAGALTHRNIVSILDTGCDKATEQHFIVMEYMPGGSLADRIDAEGRLEVDAAVDALTQALDGLMYAHERGVIHRDVTPSNLMTDRDGTVKVGDFGIAKVMDAVASTPSTRFGNPSYMSPEHRRGDELDARSDLYSIGVVAYELLSGMFPGQAAVEIGLEQGHPRLDHMVPSIPPALARAVDRALSESPDGRPADAAELAVELRRAAAPADAELPEPRPVPAMPRRSAALAAGAAAVALLAALQRSAGAAARAAAAQRRRVASALAILAVIVLSVRFRDDLAGGFRDVTGLLAAYGLWIAMATGAAFAGIALARYPGARGLLRPGRVRRLALRGRRRRIHVGRVRVGRLLWLVSVLAGGGAAVRLGRSGRWQDLTSYAQDQGDAAAAEWTGLALQHRALIASTFAMLAAIALWRARRRLIRIGIGALAPLIILLAVALYVAPEALRGPGSTDLAPPQVAQPPDAGDPPGEGGTGDEDVPEPSGSGRGDNAGGADRAPAASDADGRSPTASAASSRPGATVGRRQAISSKDEGCACGGGDAGSGDSSESKFADADNESDIGIVVDNDSESSASTEATASGGGAAAASGEAGGSATAEAGAGAATGQVSSSASSSSQSQSQSQVQGRSPSMPNIPVPEMPDIPEPVIPDIPEPEIP